MLQQIKYFQAVVQNNSFSEAAEECHISQSAISQQIKALEQALGFPLLERKNRRFSLTPAGEYFYRKSLILVADYEQLCREAAGIARGGQPVIRIGHLCSCDNREACLAREAFAARYTRVSIQITYGDHEELFEALRGGQIDLALNDQRRSFSDEYVNLVLAVRPMSVEVASRSPLAAAASLTVEELKNIPCILVASQSQQEQERDYYQTVIGVQSSFLYANTLEEARLLVVGGQGYRPAIEPARPGGGGRISRVPLYRGSQPITQNQCLFWKKDNSGYYIETFAEILKEQFCQEDAPDSH